MKFTAVTTLSFAMMMAVNAAPVQEVGWGAGLGGKCKQFLPVDGPQALDHLKACLRTNIPGFEELGVKFSGSLFEDSDHGKAVEKRGLLDDLRSAEDKAFATALGVVRNDVPLAEKAMAELEKAMAKAEKTVTLGEKMLETWAKKTS